MRQLCSGGLVILLLLAGCQKGRSPYYLSLLSSTENEVLKIEAIRYLGEHGVKRAIEPLLAIARDSSQSLSVRVESIGALSRLGSVSVVEELIPLLEEKELVPELIVALARLRSERSTRTLMELASKPGEFQLSAIWALGALRDRTAVPLLHRLTRHPDKYVSYNARQALKKIGSAGGF